MVANGRAVTRVNDAGVHTACCAANTWTAMTGSRSVVINGQQAHRVGDLVRHCGGTEQTVEGSANVLVGAGTGATDVQSPARLFDEHFVLVDDRSGRPIVNRAYRIETDGGYTLPGRT